MNNGVVVFLIERVAGQEYDPAWGEKIPFILGGLAGLVLVWLLISCWYWKRFSHSPRLRHLFFWTVGVLVSVVVFKLGVHHFYKNYWGDRWFFYAIPSPRIQGFTWFLLPLIIFSTFLYFRSKIETLKERQFLVVIWAVFVSLALSVAGIRGGVASIIDPLTRTFWEYTGALPFIQARGTIKFLHEFISLLPALPVHVQVHPPGYALALYFWQRLFQVGNLGLALIEEHTPGAMRDEVRAQVKENTNGFQDSKFQPTNTGKASEWNSKLAAYFSGEAGRKVNWSIVGDRVLDGLSSVFDTVGGVIAGAINTGIDALSGSGDSSPSKGGSSSSGSSNSNADWKKNVSTFHRERNVP